MIVNKGKAMDLYEVAVYYQKHGSPVYFYSLLLGEKVYHKVTGTHEKCEKISYLTVVSSKQERVKFTPQRKTYPRLYTWVSQRRYVIVDCDMIPEYAKNLL